MVFRRRLQKRLPKQPPLASPFNHFLTYWAGLLLFAGLSVISGSVNAVDMELGLATTCEFTGLIAAVILARKY